ncbi:hypothetical protein ACFV1L_21525 [Kitasatospora sp. NPDC059646]|uniref:hypothetical protein n=1 Tax=Kitasatospora sp. NPDC059646 TaxID=3346893 RepID=UPI0036C9FF46
MRCDLCDHDLATLDLPPSRWYREIRICTWCRAVVRVGLDGSIVRQGYSAWDLRWEAARTDMLPEPRRHAYGYFRRTLCGIERPDMSGSPFGMWGGEPDECPECTAEALAVDARWPEDRREDPGRTLLPASGPGPVHPSERDPLPDELGHPDVPLPEPRWSPHTRVLAERPTAPATDRHRTLGDGPSALRLPVCWAGYGIGLYRPYDGDGRTFAWLQAYPPDRVPPLDEARFTGDYAWFGETGEPLEHRTAVTDPIAAELARDGLRLPADFVALITRARLHRCLDRVGGGAWTDVSAAVPSPLDPADKMVAFLRDQQSCFVRYLYLHHSGRSAVVGSGRDFTVEWGVRYGPDGEVVAPPRPELFWTAPSTEVFAYRFLAEGSLIDAIEERARPAELDPEHLAYLAHYRSGAGGG